MEDDMLSRIARRDRFCQRTTVSKSLAVDLGHNSPHVVILFRLLSCGDGSTIAVRLPTRTDAGTAARVIGGGTVLSNEVDDKQQGLYL